MDQIYILDNNINNILKQGFLMINLDWNIEEKCLFKFLSQEKII